jgi:LDH2 family malate/lactate/ureidoglycolate dehydrogenase
VFVAISPAWSREPSAFQASVANLVRAVHATATAGGQPAMVPGEPEDACRARLGPQIRLPGPTLAELLEVARDTTLPFPAAADPAPGDSQEEVS